MKRFLVIGTLLITRLPLTGYGQILPPVDDLCPPIANDDHATTNENTPVSINVVGNDADCLLDILLGGIDPGTVDLNTSAGGVQNSNTTAQGSYTANSSGVVTFTPAENFSGTASINYTVKDKAGKTSNAAKITITVIASNDPPVANAGSDKNITLPDNSLTLSGSGSDPDGTITSYAWTKVSGPEATLGGANTATLSVSNQVQGTYVFSLQVTDNDGATGTDEVTVVVNPAANQAPTANAGQDQSITLPDNSLTLSGSGSDPDGTITSYAWTKVSGPAATLSGANTATLSVSDLVQGTYVFSLKVTDNDGAIGTDEVTIVVNPATVNNQPPTANAGPNQSITLPVNSLSISGSGSDPDGTITAYAWTKVSGPEATLSGANTATLSVSNLVQGTYVFSLKVTDNDGATGTDEVTIVVHPATVNNQPPTANAGPNQSITLPVNSLTLSGSGSDADGTITAYAWTKVSGPEATLSGANTATLSLSNLVQGTYVFSLKVTDNGGATGTDEVTIVVNPAGVDPANQLPVANNDNTSTSKNQAVTINVVANDTDTDGTINAETVDLNITEPGIQNTQTTDHGNFTVNTNGDVTFTPAQDYSGMASTSYIVNDNAGATSNAASITVKVEDAPAAKLDIPTGFTPNGDGANETWKILPRDGTEELRQFQDAELRVYNKHGVLLYKATGLENPWNGMQNGERLPADTYFYTIALKNNREIYKGTVTILR